MHGMLFAFEPEGSSCIVYTLLPTCTCTEIHTAAAVPNSGINLIIAVSAAGIPHMVVTAAACLGVRMTCRVVHVYITCLDITCLVPLQTANYALSMYNINKGFTLLVG